MSEDINYIHKQYWIKKRSIQDLSEELDISDIILIKFMRENDIPIRQKDKKKYPRLCLGPKRIRIKPETREASKVRQQRKLAKSLIGDPRFKKEQLIKLHSQGRYRWLTAELLKDVKKRGI